MPILVTCPGCGLKNEVLDAAAGYKARCMSCHAAVPVPPLSREEQLQVRQLRVLESIRNACWIIAGIIIALLVLSLLAFLIAPRYF
jgi:hypothetical protein